MRKEGILSGSSYAIEGISYFSIESTPRDVCGHMAILMWEFEKAGNICVGLHYLPSEYFEGKDYLVDNGLIHHLAEQEGIAPEMDELHKRKIDLADEIFVVNVKGYIGSSTRSEIEYATKHGKPVRYLENQ